MSFWKPGSGQALEEPSQAGAAEGTGKHLWGSSAGALSPERSMERPIEFKTQPRALGKDSGKPETQKR